MEVLGNCSQQKVTQRLCTANIMEQFTIQWIKGNEVLRVLRNWSRPRKRRCSDKSLNDCLLLEAGGLVLHAMSP